MSRNRPPDLLPGIADEDIIGVPKEEFSLILVAVAKGWSTAEVARCSGTGEDRAAYVKELIEASGHMRHVYAPESDGPARSWGKGASEIAPPRSAR